MHDRMAAILRDRLSYKEHTTTDLVHLTEEKGKCGHAGLVRN
jgi:hypothetical protein